MQSFITAIDVLIEAFARLPGVGIKSAQRLAFHILAADQKQVEQFATALLEAKTKVEYCQICGNFTENSPCRICSSTKRNHQKIMVVEQAKDVFVLENTAAYDGLYHVLHGAISPLDGIGPDEIAIKPLLNRLNAVDEVILATNPTVEGEATAMYLARLIQPLGIKVTRIARGVPVGGDIEYVDASTLEKALEGRRQI